MADTRPRGAPHQSYLSGRNRTIGQGIRIPVPIDLDPEAFQGALIYGTDDELYLSTGTEWKNIADSAFLRRTITERRRVTVHQDDTHPNQLESDAAHFNTVSEALAYAAGFFPTVAVEPYSIEIRLLSGFVFRDPVQVYGVDLGHVIITADDSLIVVEEDSLTTRDQFTNRFSAFNYVDCPSAPSHNIFLDNDQSMQAENPGYNSVAFTYRATNWLNQYQSVSFNYPGASSAWGARGFNMNLVVLGGFVRLNSFGLTDAIDRNILLAMGSVAFLSNVGARGAGNYGIYLQHGSAAHLREGGTSAGAVDCRRIEGEDTPQDIYLDPDSGNNRVSIGSETGDDNDPPEERNYALGGYNVPPNQFTRPGIVSDPRAPVPEWPGIRGRGEVESEQDLPEDPDFADAYFIGDDLFVWDGFEWQNIGNLRGRQGDPIELRQGDTHIQWRYDFLLEGEGEDEWRDLLPIEDLVGPSLEFDWDGTQLGIRVEGEENFDYQDLEGPQGEIGPQGDGGWSPVLAVVEDGARRVAQIVDWTGGEGNPPPTGDYIGGNGLTSNIALATDIRGSQGETGETGDTGDTGPQGDAGWAPVLAVVEDGDRRVLQVESWTGGEGDPPPAGDYIGTTGLVSDIASAVDVRGPEGQQGEEGPQGEQGPGPDVNVEAMTQAAYDALDPPDPDTLYVITE